MLIRVLFIVVFMAGMGFGWLGRTWVESLPAYLTTNVTNDNLDGLTHSNVVSNTTQATHSASESTKSTSSVAQSRSDFDMRESLLRVPETAKAADVFSDFKKLINDRQYNEAMDLYQEQVLQGAPIATKLKSTLLEHLRYLSKSGNYSDFSALVDSYLSSYYDDIDVLLILADFNQNNGSYLEAVNVYLLAKTYAYTEVHQNRVSSKFNDFVERIDGQYTNQRNWLSLINFYSHITTTGLMTSPHLFRQAVAHLRNGDEIVATQQLNQLIGDNLVGEMAEEALSNLAHNSHTAASLENSSVIPAESTASLSTFSVEGAESIALQPLGNQYLVNLTVNRQDEINLLIDTGASVTTLSRTSFEALSTNGDAIEQGQRVFRTASGVAMGTMYKVSELSLGSYTMENLQIAVLDVDMSDSIDGLLGMNVLGQFRFQIDQENARLLLDRQ